MGEAYCPAFMGQRISEWEAAAQRRADAQKARTAAAASQEVRVRLQEEIEEAKKQRRRATREREEIHPPHVLEALAAMQEPPPSSLRLPEAKPDPDGEYPVHVLPIRPHEKETNL